MKRNFLLLLLVMLSLSTYAKKYPWYGLHHHEYIVQQISVTADKNRVCKVWGVAGGVDKAIDMALQNAVVAALFYGWEPGMSGVSGMSPILGESYYETNEKYFIDFFKSGAFMNYVSNINKNYPTGENNVSTKDGRKIGINIKIDIEGLINKMDADGIKTKKIGF